VFNIPLRVRNLIKRHGTCSSLRIAAYLKVTVFYGRTPPKINGLWRRILKRKYIYVNEELEEDWQIEAVIAHEIAHILLHPGYRCYCIAGRTYVANAHFENEADQFSAELISQCYGIDKLGIIDFLQNGWRVKKQ
jgi:Zn-dependent peptidase ImmA (M78 family)